MSLTLKKYQDLNSVDLTDLFRKKRDLWYEKARQAYDYTKMYVEVGGNKIRQDDVLKVLVPNLEVLDALQKHLDLKKLRQKYWYTWFAELIIDQLWDELRKEN